MKNILVPFDFSIHATNAFKFALNIAKQSNATIHLIHVIELPVLNGQLLGPAYDYETPFLNELTEKAEKEFTKLKDNFKLKGVTVVSKIDFGSPSVKILTHATTESIDLIVMGSHGSSGLVEFFLGSNTEKVVRKSPVPVLVIKNNSTGIIKNIVFPTALETEHEESLVERVKELQEFFKAKLHLVFINTPMNFKSDDVNYTKLLAFAIRFGLTNYTLNVYNHIDKEEGIRQFTKKAAGDLIAIGTYGQKGIAHLLNGSLAEDVANHADIPIWTYSLKTQLVEA